jgi:hypothetical protein
MPVICAKGFAPFALSLDIRYQFRRTSEHLYELETGQWQVVSVRYEGVAWQ